MSMLMGSIDIKSLPLLAEFVSARQNAGYKLYSPAEESLDKSMKKNWSEKTQQNDTKFKVESFAITYRVL